MASSCPHCGSTRNPIGATVCIVCKNSLSPSGPSIPSSKAILTVSGGRKYHLSPASPTLIGSRGCAILLSGMGVEPQHAKLTPLGGGFMIEPVLGTVLLNGKTISSPTNLIPGATISIGSQTLSYSGPASSLIPSVSKAPVSSTFMPVLASKSPTIVKKTPSFSITRVKSIFKKISNPDPVLEGQVVVADGPHQEQPDIAWVGLLVRVWFGLLLSPIVILLFFVMPALLIPFLLYGLGQRNPQVPARYLRVEDKSGKQYSVKMKGDSVGGMLNLGDAASYWGRWKNGTLIMSKAWNRTANSQVLLRTTVRRRINTIVLILIVVVTTACLISFGLNY